MSRLSWRNRLLDNKIPEGYIRIAPDLAVEVLSPSDIQYDVDRKVAEYLEAGVQLVWGDQPRHTDHFHLPSGWISQHHPRRG